MAESVFVQYQTILSATDELFNVRGVGMGYVLRTKAGSLIVIDGGNEEDAESFLRCLQELSGQDSVHVSRWFITHPHSDHYGALLAISRCEALRAQLQVDELLFSTPPRETVDVRSHVYAPMVDDLTEMVQNMGAKLTTPVPGDIFEVDEARVSIVSTWIDLEEILDPNDTSMTMMLEASGTRILILGDGYDAAAANALRRWGDRLRCDICQVAHHGLRGGSIELYQTASPALYLLPSNRATMNAFNGKYPANAWVFAHAPRLHVMGDGTLMIPLPFEHA